MGRSLPRLEAAAKELSAATGKECVAVAGDVRKPQEVEAAVDLALKKCVCCLCTMSGW